MQPFNAMKGVQKVCKTKLVIAKNSESYILGKKIVKAKKLD